jgi:hypothetical protein
MPSPSHVIFSRQNYVYLFFIGIALFCSILPGTAQSADVTLAWDANSESDLSGYRVFCGESSGNYSITHDIKSSDPNEPPPTTCEFTGLQEGKKYYFAAVAYNQNSQSNYSQEIAYTVPVATAESDKDNDGYTEAQGDCNDTNPDIHPGAVEICGDGIDQDCNGLIDDSPGCLTWCHDADGDGFGDAANQVHAMLQPDGYVGDCSDCDDTDYQVNIAQPETCNNGIDDNCNGHIDEQCTPVPVKKFSWGNLKRLFR